MMAAQPSADLFGRHPTEMTPVFDQTHGTFLLVDAAFFESVVDIPPVDTARAQFVSQAQDAEIALRINVQHRICPVVDQTCFFITIEQFVRRFPRTAALTKPAPQIVPGAGC